MRVATGAGKVSILSSAAAAGEPTLLATLFNFDVDDATVKTEHQRFLAEKIVQAVKGNVRAHVALRGTASRSGAADHNRRLSERRVNAVADFLAGQGVKKTQISRTFTGEDLSVSSLNEDETERAVFVSLLTIPKLDRSVRFARANPANPCDGFHDNVQTSTGPVTRQNLMATGLPISNLNVSATTFSDPTLIVTSGFINFVALRNGLFMDVSIEGDTNVAKLVDPFGKEGPGPVKVDMNALRVKGGSQEGTVAAVARDATGQEVARMKIVNVAPITVEVAFTYLKDPSGVATSRTKGQEAGQLTDVNSVYNNQTGIFFKAGNVRGSFSIPEFGSATDVVLHSIQRFGDANSPHKTADWQKIYPKHRDHSAEFNVFYVRNIKDTAGSLLKLTGGISEIVTTPSEFRNVIIDNRTLNSLVQPDFINLAHELGHSLGQTHTKDPISLMFEGVQVGRHINFTMAFQMRNNLKKFTQK